MKMQSIRLDIQDTGMKGPELKRLLAAALRKAAAHNAVDSEAEALGALADAAQGASVNDYDDQYGGPVFYIP
jgi:hypothetical protein